MDSFFCKELPKNRKKPSQVVKKNKNLTVKAGEGHQQVNGVKHNVSRKPFALSTTKPKSQSYLDFGQKSFGKSIACPKCSMLYVLGVEEDEKNHRKHCRSRQHLHIDSLSIESLRHEWESQAQESVSVSLSPHNSDSSWQDTSSSRSSSGSVHVVWEDVQQKVCIIKINMDADVFRNSSKLSALRWRAVVGVILADMGAPDCTVDEVGGTLFLYVDTAQGRGIVMGMVISEKVRNSDLHLFCPKVMCSPPTTTTKAEKEVKENILLTPRRRTEEVFPSDSIRKKTKLNNYIAGKLEITSTDHGAGGGTSVTNSCGSGPSQPRPLPLALSEPLPLTLFSTDYSLLPPLVLHTPPPLLRQALQEATVTHPGPFVVGIKQMWVSAQHRRRGIARQLLECVRTAASADSRCPLFISAHERFKIAFSQPTSDGLHFALRYVAPVKAVWLYAQSSLNMNSNSTIRTKAVGDNEEYK